MKQVGDGQSDMAIQQGDDGALRELALFAGAGGGILGGKLLGWKTICAVERDAYAANVLAQRQNDGCLEPFPIWSDVRTFDGKPWYGIVDVVSGGFPCQDISSAGKGAGIEGERSGLWKEFFRIVCDIRPRFVFVENSPMLTSRGLGVVLGDLAGAGYDTEWECISAGEIGAPHERNRIWILASNTKRDQEREKSCCWPNRRMGRIVKQIPWDGDWEDKMRSLRGMGNGLANTVDRTDRIRNGQVPVVAATAFIRLLEKFNR